MNSTMLSFMKTHTKTSRDSMLESWLSPIQDKNAKRLLLSIAAGEESVVSTDPASFQQHYNIQNHCKNLLLTVITFSF